MFNLWEKSTQAKSSEKEFRIDNYIVCLFDLMGQKDFLAKCKIVTSDSVAEYQKEVEALSSLICSISKMFEKLFNKEQRQRDFCWVNQGFSFRRVKEIAYSSPENDSILFEKLAREKYGCSPQGIVGEEVRSTVEQIRGAAATLKDSLERLYPKHPRFFIHRLLNARLKAEYRNSLRVVKQDVVAQNQCIVKLQRFSDTFVFYSKMQGEQKELFLSPMQNYLGATAMIMIFFLHSGHPLRGAICFGTGWEIKENDFYGYSLARAHHLEEKDADYPRLIIDNDLYDILQREATRENPPSEFIRKTAKECLRLCTKDQDGRIILDYLGEYMAEGLKSYNNYTNHASMVRQSYLWILKQLADYKDENEKLYSKYEKFKRYFDSRMGYWD